jgi:hypothetical protein
MRSLRRASGYIYHAERDAAPGFQSTASRNITTRSTTARSIGDGDVET